MGSYVQFRSVYGSWNIDALWDYNRCSFSKGILNNYGVKTIKDGFFKSKGIFWSLKMVMYFVNIQEREREIE